uniref:Alpha-L-fucosidase 2 n=1 Tax=Aquisalinus luteolus TaxID=1566827 RepID=A0A8J3ENY1_9PROT|nr:hypothetical protein GCM10011355_01880 [Aquisalinus luteolus]
MFSLAVAVCLAGGCGERPVDGAASDGRVDAATSQTAPQGEGDVTLWYDAPAQDWETQALPVGNGAMGAMVTGGIREEILQFNEKTLWTGGPGSTTEGGAGPDNPYSYGRPTDSLAGELAAVQADLAERGSMSPEEVAGRLGIDPVGYGHYQSFGDLVLSHGGIGEDLSDYRRSLDLSTGVASVTYTQGGIAFSRNYFASYPDGVIVVHLSASEPGALDLSASLALPENRSVQVEAGEDRLTARGALDDNGLRYETSVGVMISGGSHAVEGEAITVEGADEAWFVIAAGTDYAPFYPDYRGDDPAPDVQRRIDAALAKGGEALLRDHLADFTPLMNAMTLDLQGAAPDMPTGQVLAAYRDLDPAERRWLEQAYFQYGRYLLVSSSRPGSLPANLQGVWNNSMYPPWNADYHVNINLQMNYWPAEVTNLSSMAQPLFDYVDTLVPSGEVSARQIADADGWMISLNSNIYGFTGLISWPTAFWQPEAGAWLTRHYYEHYEFTGDEAFLRERAWPVMKGQGEFWLDMLVEDARDGSLVVSPSYSPEQGDFTAGAAMSQQIVYDLFTHILEASEILGQPDADFATRIEEARERLDPGLRIGSWGQLQEWKEDLDDPENDHRHVSQLYALHPGDAIVPGETPELAAAARATLDGRGDGGTGWSKAWKVNFWARLHDGNRAYKLLGEQLVHSTMPNLLDTHPPFQIDGNFGATAGIAEMLIQSHGAAIDILPSLPSAWEDGAAKGLRVRGAATVDIEWTGGLATRVSLTSDEGGDYSIRVTGECSISSVSGAGGENKNGLFSIPLGAGETALITCEQAG